MTMLPFSAPTLSRPGLELGRVLSVIATMLAVFAEAHEQALAVERRLSPHGAAD